MIRLQCHILLRTFFATSNQQAFYFTRITRAIITLELRAASPSRHVVVALEVQVPCFMHVMVTQTTPACMSADSRQDATQAYAYDPDHVAYVRPLPAGLHVSRGYTTGRSAASIRSCLPTPASDKGGGYAIKGKDGQGVGRFGLGSPGGTS